MQTFENWLLRDKVPLSSNLMDQLPYLRKEVTWKYQEVTDNKKAQQLLFDPLNVKANF